MSKVLSMPEHEKEPLVYYQPIQKLITVRDTQYVFVVKCNISLAYINPEHVDSILNIRGGCCGQSKRGVFRRATDQEIRLWNGLADR